MQGARGEPPKRFPAERGERVCGGSWWRPLTVSGELPNYDGFGRDLEARIEPIFKSAEIDDGKIPGSFGRNSHTEVALREAARDRIEDIQDWREMYSEDLGGETQQSLRWLLDRAEYQLDKINEIYDGWTYRSGGTWPLHLGDTLSDFPQRDRCSLFSVRCPTGTAEAKERKADRKQIRKLLLSALRHVRCAEYWMHKVRLQTQAWRLLEELPPGKRPGPARTRDPSCEERTFRLFLSQGLDQAAARQRAQLVCMDRPWIGVIVDPDSLPPPDSDEDPGGDIGPPSETGTDEPADDGAKKGLLIAGGLAAAALLLPRLLR